jgi:hypothetical protein
MPQNTQLGRLFEDVEAVVARVTAKQAMDDPGTQDGSSSHPSAKLSPESANEKPPVEGARSSENTSDAKANTPTNGVESHGEAKHKAPEQSAQEYSQGIESPKPALEGAERSFNGKPTGDEKDGDMGGTSHPAKGSYGEKYSADALARVGHGDLVKIARDLGNEIAADIANGRMTGTAPTAPAAPAATPAQKAAQDGYAAAAAAGDQEKASAVVTETVKQAHVAAARTFQYLSAFLKQADGEESPEAESSETDEQKPSEGESAPPSGESAPPAGESAPPSGESLPPAGPPAGPAGDPTALLGAMEAAPPAPGPAAPPVQGLDQNQLLQLLTQVLMEQGVTPDQLSAGAAGTPDAPAVEKLASAVTKFAADGQVRFAPPKTPQEKRAKDYMRGVVQEIVRRNAR